MLIRGQCYCQRHGNTLNALEKHALDGIARGDGNVPVPHHWITGEKPGLRNRAPSLVEWVSNQLDAYVQALLERTGGPDSAPLIEHGSVSPFRTESRDICWQRSWCLHDQAGPIVEVAVRIKERQPTVVIITVGQHVVAKSVPPWVDHNEKHEALDDSTDARERDEYFSGLSRAIENGVQALAQNATGWPTYPR